MSWVSRKCLACEHVQKTFNDKNEEYQKVTVCPKCNGAFVDRYRYELYAKKDKPNSLLTIELEDETSVPKVFYKGEEIKHKCNVFLDWDTDTDTFGGLTYSIEHIDTGKGYPAINRIERKVKGHAFD
ncbi:hypothetical protein JUJ52_11095 [Virgibacillus sp. AGTR]|uniref:hypothetical protein n=1 Tax=unclassified Virgibacillus TaxID=2620237 RepID=UPI000EF4B59A|nr:MULTISPECIES: hypothetical protein [unclassified Virgibacillus]MCC2250507.1 hypothetical protein [Virgibacillus sp. AGTR]